jgi:hypothetical protein
MKIKQKVLFHGNSVIAHGPTLNIHRSTVAKMGRRSYISF